MAPSVAARKAGALLFLLWSVLHIWVPLEGFRVHAAAGLAGTSKMLTGGSAVPHGAYRLPTDAATASAQTHLFLNFVSDVGGYGVLGLFVARGLWLDENATLCYALGALVIGIADLAFTFCMVLPGIIELNLGSIAGPIIWVIALVVTPFGLAASGAAKASSKRA